MKTKKYVEDLRTKSIADLNEELVAAKKELFNLRFQNATNQLDNTSRIKEVRKIIRTLDQVNWWPKVLERSIVWKGI
jgi:large subunit ribosomal protein L29